MNIYPYMLGLYDEYLQERIIARYMRYPPDNKPREGVLHRHAIGLSQHGDLRGRVTDHLIGWALVGYSAEKPFTLEELLSGKKIRAEPKCFSVHCNEWAYRLIDVKEDGTPIVKYRTLTELSELMPEELASQPLVWLKVEGKVPPGKVGARIEKPGEFTILWGTVKNKEQWKKKPRGTELTAKEIPFTLHFHYYKGPRIIRWAPHMEWYLRLDIKGKGKIRSFYIEGNPLRESPLPAVDEGYVERKWFDYEGEVRPGERYMPFKTLIGKMEILDRGTVQYEVTRLPDGREYISLLFKGKRLKGRWRLVQTEEGALEYDFEALSRARQSTELREGRFVYHLHTIVNTGKHHYDLRYHFNNEPYLREFNLYDDLREKGIDEEVKAAYKRCYDLSWMDIKEPDTKKNIGKLVTVVSPLDEGIIQLIEDTDVFKSFFLRGKQLNGWYVAIKREGQWYVSESRLPRPLSLSELYESLSEYVSLTDPLKGEYYRPFKIVQKRGWDYFRVDIYDIKDFARCEPAEKTVKYLPDLEIPAGVREIRIGLFPRKGALHGARIQSIIFDVDKWSYEDAIRWIKKNRLHIWLGTQIKERRKE